MLSLASRGGGGPSLASKQMAHLARPVKEALRRTGHPRHLAAFQVALAEPKTFEAAQSAPLSPFSSAVAAEDLSISGAGWGDGDTAAYGAGHRLPINQVSLSP